jgi:uncharacterized protein (UPF0335 family)
LEAVIEHIDRLETHEQARASKVKPVEQFEAVIRQVDELETQRHVS